MEQMLLLEPVRTQEAQGEELRGLADRYVRFCAAHLDQFGDYVSRHDLASVSRIAHILRGNAGRIGLSELSSLGRQLEEYCLGNDWGAIDSAYQAIADTVCKLCGGRPVRVEIDVKVDGRAQAFEVKRGQ